MNYGFAVIHPGLEPIVAAELAGLGVDGEVVPGGVRFKTDPGHLASLARSMRTPSQLLLELASGPTRSTEALGALVRRVPWRTMLHPQSPVTVDVSTKSSTLHFRENVARSVGNQIREARKGPFVPDRAGRPTQTQRVQVRIADDVATLSIDAGGELLHRRGWRTDAGKAPLRENLAACLLAMAEWDGSDALVDPFCGSGTVLIEAALLAAGKSPFVGRTLACDEWLLGGMKPGAGKPGAGPRTNAGRGGPKGAGPRGSTAPRGGAAARGGALLTAKVPLVGSDHYAPTLATAQDNARRAGVAITWKHCEMVDIEPPAVIGTIVTNPPWGVRLGERVDGVYVNFGRMLRERFQSWRVVFLAPHEGLASRVDQRVERLTQFKNGGVSVSAWVYLP